MLLIRKILLLLLFTSTVFILVALFVGVTWAVLFIAIIHLLITLIPFNGRLTYIALGREHYERLQSARAKRKGWLVYKVIIIFTNLVIFSVVFTVFDVNVRLIDHWW